MIKNLVFASLVLMLVGCFEESAQKKIVKTDINAGVIYGEDSIQEVNTKKNPQANSQSSVALVKTINIIEADNNNFIFNDATVQEKYSACSEFNLSEQISPAFCSGVLISPNLILTAGHCMSQSASCDETSFVFGFEKESSIASSNIFKCKRVIHNSEAEQAVLDYALVEIDRPAPYTPVIMNSKLSTTISPDYVTHSAIYSIGYPLGTSKKKSEGFIRQEFSNKGEIIAELDVFSGDSGSPVFDNETNQLIGILVAGETDFLIDSKRRCERVKQCLEGTCSGEAIIPIWRILQDLKTPQ